MSIESSIDLLTSETTTLLDTCVSLKNNTAQLIANAVTVSENASQIPLVVMAKNLIDTQTLFVNYVSETP